MVALQLTNSLCLLTDADCAANVISPFRRIANFCSYFLQLLSLACTNLKAGLKLVISMKIQILTITHDAMEFTAC